MSGIQNVIFDIGNVLVKWDPYQAMTDLFEDRGAMMRALQEIGFFVWNHEQDRGRSWEEGLAWAEQNRTGRSIWKSSRPMQAISQKRCRNRSMDRQSWCNACWPGAFGFSA